MCHLDPPGSDNWVELGSMTGPRGWAPGAIANDFYWCVLGYGTAIPLEQIGSALGGLVDVKRSTGTTASVRRL